MALQLKIEANDLNLANQIAEEYTSFIRKKAKIELAHKKRISYKNKVRVIYTYHITDSLSYDVSKSMGSKLSLMDEQLDKIVEREYIDKPKRDKNEIKKKLCDIYQKKYWGALLSLPSLLKTEARNKLMKDIKMGVLAWIYSEISERIIKRTAQNEDFSYNEISGNPYSAIVFSNSSSSSKAKTRIKILPWYYSLKDEKPDWGWLEIGEENKSELEEELEKKGTEEWLEYLSRQDYIGTQVIGLKYKNLEDRNKILKNYSLLPQLFEKG